jgi:HD-like signal output (HDOD) protein
VSNNLEIDYLLEEVITLPSISQTVMHLTEMMNDPELSLADVGKLISSAPSLALKTPRIVNSAFHGLRETVTSVEHAVTLFGIKVVRNLVPPPPYLISSRTAKRYSCAIASAAASPCARSANRAWPLT